MLVRHRLFGVVVLAALVLVGSAVGSVAQTAPPVAVAAGADPVLAQVFGDWIYRCQSVPASSGGSAGGAVASRRTCEIAQQLVLQQQDKAVPVMTVALTALAAGQPYAATVLAPLGVQLQPPLSLSVDSGRPVSLEYAFCTAAGCFARGPVGALAAQLKHGRQGHARIVLGDGRGVTLNFALNGVADALAAFESGRLPLVASAPLSIAAPVAASGVGGATPVPVPAVLSPGK